MAMVNVNNLLNGKDSRWLQLEVCREFQRNKCTRSDTECKFAHPPSNVEVQNGRVTACFDSMKGRCNRDKPPCKYFHPPQQLKDQLLINGRNHLALKNALLHQMGFAPPSQQTVIANQMPSVFPTPNAAAAAAVASIPLGQPQLGLMANPYFQGISSMGSAFNPYFANAQMMPAAAASLLGADHINPLSLAVHQSLVAQQQKMARINDRIESQNTAVGLANLNNASQTPIDVGRKRPHDPSDDLLMAFPGIVPYKRAADDKSGVPVYQQNAAAAVAAAAAYQQLLQPFMPVTCEYRLPASSSAFSTTANAAASAYAGITLNKPTTPSTPAHSAAAAAMAAAAAASVPRYHTSTAGQFNQGFTNHFFPSLAMAAMRPNLPGFPSLSIPTPVASTHLSELLAAAQQFSNFTNHNGNLSSNSNISNNNLANGLSSNGSVVGHTVHTNSNSINNCYVEIGNETGNNSSNYTENKNGPNVVVPHNNCDENLQQFKKVENS